MERENEFLRRRSSFGEKAEAYDFIRPDYPEETIDDIIRFARVQPDAAILELGCGSGKATLPFARRGFNITALDISPQLIEVAKKNLGNYDNVQYITDGFENVRLDPQRYDLIVSAQAFHWIDPGVRYRKTHDVLKDQGHLAIFANFKNHERSTLEREMDVLYRKLCPNYPPDYGTLEKFKNQLRNSGLFSDPLQKSYERIFTYSKDDYINLQKSFSWIATLDETSRAKFFLALNDILGTQEKIAVPWQTILLLAQKRE